jgi:copper chaperone
VTHMKKVRFKVMMHCASCEELISDSIRELAGIRKVRASQKEGIVEVTYDENVVDVDKLKGAIGEQGFSVKGTGGAL